jgi:hypothetical protein
MIEVAGPSPVLPKPEIADLAVTNPERAGRFPVPLMNE